MQVTLNYKANRGYIISEILAFSYVSKDSGKKLLSEVYDSARQMVCFRSQEGRRRSADGVRVEIMRKETIH